MDWQQTLNPTKIDNYDDCLAAVRRNGRSLKCLLRDHKQVIDGLSTDQRFEIYLQALTTYGNGLKYIDDAEFTKEQQQQLCLTAVMNNGRALVYIKHQTPELCLAAVKQDSFAINYVDFSRLDRQSRYHACLAAIDRRDSRYKWLLMSKGALRISVGLTAKQWKRIRIVTLHRDGMALNYIDDQTPEMCMIAVQQCGSALRYVKHQTPEICLAAVKKYCHAIKYVKDQTPELCMIAVQKDGWAIKYIRNQTPELCREALMTNKYCFKHIRERTYDLCLLAVQRNGGNLKYVHEQTMDICFVASKNPNFEYFDKYGDYVEYEINDPLRLKYIKDSTMRDECAKYLDGIQFMFTKSAKKLIY